MNRVYKVIWSKAKHCYVVTSEVAKGYGKSAGSKGVKALLSGLVALSIAMGGYGMAGAVFVDSRNAEEGAYNTPVYTTEEVYTKEETGDKFATKDELNAKANAADVVNKTNAEVTFLTVSGDVEAHGNLKVGNGNFTVNGITGNVTTGNATIGDALIVKGDTEMKGDLGVKGNLFAGGYTETDAKAALNADGSIKGAEGKFTVGTDGKVTAAYGKIGTVDITSDGALTGMKSLGVENINAGGTITGNKLTDGVASLQAGNLNTTGNINAHDINAHDIVATGDISGKAISGTTITSTPITGTSLNTKGGDISGGAITGTTITGTSLNTQNGEINGGDIKSSGAIEGNSLTLKGGKLDAGSGTITTTGNINGNNINATGKITTKDLEVTGGLKTDHITLGSEPNNYTDINKGNVTSSIHETSGAVGYTAESVFNKGGSSITVRTNEGRVDSTGISTVGSQIITQYLGNNAVPDGNNVTKRMVRNGNGTFSMVDTAVYGKNKYSTVSQNAEERKVTVTDGENTASTNLTAADIKNTAENGMISNTAKNLVNTATENMTNTVGKDLTTTVTGDSSLTAENITNEAKNKITNKALDVETDAASSIVSKVSNDYGSNTSTQLSHQTMEEMKAEGKTASYLRGAAEEKSQLTDGAKKTTIDTVAGQTNTNITEGKNVSNSLQKADQIASSVTDGTNTTVVNQNAGSLASSITDGTKANNTSSTVDKSEQLIKVDDTHFYAETKTAGSAVEALKSDGNTIISAKDAVTGTVSSAVTDGATITGISQNAKDISLSAAGGTITNDANDVLNKGTNSVINEVGANQVAVMTDSVKAAYGLDTYTTWDGNGITSNTSGNMSNTVGGKMLNNVTGDMENKVGGNLTNSAVEIENKASSSIWNHVGEGYNTSWKMTDGKISESIVNGTASNKENTTAEGTKRIITSEEGTGTYNQTATSNNISLKNKAGDTSFTKSESLLKGEKTSVTNPNGSSTINQSAESIVNFVKNTEGHATKTEQSAKDITNTAKNGTITNDAKIVKTITGKNTVTSDNGGTTFENEAHSTAVKYGTVKKTTISGNTIETGQATMDYADVTKDLSVGGNATVENDLTVKGASEFVGKADFRYDVFMDENLTVAKETRTDTLYVDHDGYVGGNLNVEGNIETHDAVLSADSRQVVTGRQLYQTNERVDKLDNRIKKVGANAAALAALRPGDFNPDDKFSIAAGFGSYRNANAAALGLFYRPNENVLLSLGTSFGDGENMVNAGVSVKFGRGKSMAERRKEMADEVSSMRDEMRSQDERIAELEEMLKKQSELIEKLSKES
ncbi:ESPR-type extended signal peptide-containing protein [Dialister succinatiphilus]|uniref:ESPR-type extended signal peptide-containing protein n=1 Tax=Dialister succinatiphilus TaxID=487173 RepID=UPI003F80240A